MYYVEYEILHNTKRSYPKCIKNFRMEKIQMIRVPNVIN